MDQKQNSESQRLILAEGHSETEPEDPAPPKLSSGLSYSAQYKLWKIDEPVSAEHIGQFLAKILDAVVSSNKTRAPVKTIFNCAKTPAISLPDYLRRIAKFSQCSPESLVLAVIYVDRFQLASPEFFIGQQNVHKSAH